MEVFPLIHSRTGECDYNPQFAVRPKIFNDTNISWARSKILPATRNIGSFDGIRRVVASDGKICIAGVVCTMKYFVNNCLSDDEQQAAQPYVDVQGRKYGVFLGYAFKGDAPDVSYSELWQWFNKYLAGEWNRKSFKGVESVAEDCASLSGTKNFTPSAECFSAQIYDAEQFDDKELFDMYLFETAKRNVAFCSNVENIQRVEEGVYNAVTTSAGNIAKLQAHWQEEQDRPKREEAERQREAERQHEAEHPVTADAGKKNSTTTSQPPSQTWKYLLLFLLVVLIGSAVIMYWKTHQPVSDSESHSALKKDILIGQTQRLNASWRKFDEQTIREFWWQEA